MNYKTYIKSKERKEKRQEYILNKNWKCEICWKKWNHLHHRNYDNVWNEKEWDLILLCWNCHKNIHFKWEFKFLLDSDTLQYREEEIKKRKSNEDKYLIERQKRNKLIRKQKIKEWKTNIDLHMNIWNWFIEKYWVEVFLDFLNIYKESNNIEEIFEIYWLDYDKKMACSFSWVLWNVNNYGLWVEDIIKFVLEYRFIEK